MESVDKLAEFALLARANMSVADWPRGHSGYFGEKNNNKPKQNVALMSQFQDKLNCHVFRTLGWHHTSRMETCFSAVWSPWTQQTSIWWSPSTRWNHRTVMWIIKYHHNPPWTYGVRSKWVKISILSALSLYAFDLLFYSRSPLISTLWWVWVQIVTLMIILLKRIDFFLKTLKYLKW